MSLGLWGAAGLSLATGACGAQREGLGLEDSGVVLLDDGGPSGAGAMGQGGLDAGTPGEKGSTNPTVCGDFRIPALTQTPDVLIVVDRSGSMRTPLVDRWGPSSAAVASIVQSLEPQVRFGLMTFPGDCLTLIDPNAQVACLSRLGALDQSLSCEPGRVDVGLGAANAQQIASALSNTQPSGATPTASSIDAASAAMLSAPSAANAGSKSILLVTDGAPNCSLGVGGLIAVGLASASGQPEAVLQTVSAIERANQSGVRTYVIGFQTDADPFLRSSLDSMAQAGGTGDTMHRRVEDQNTLVQTLRELTQQALLCELKLDQPVTDITRLRVMMAGQPLANDPVDGYTLGADKQTVSLRGASCDQLRKSNGTLVANAQILCPPPPPPPAPPGPPQLPPCAPDAVGDLIGGTCSPLDAGATPFVPPQVI